MKEVLPRFETVSPFMQTIAKQIDDLKKNLSPFSLLELEKELLKKSETLESLSHKGLLWLGNDEQINQTNDQERSNPALVWLGGEASKTSSSSTIPEITSSTTMSPVSSTTTNGDHQQRLQQIEEQSQSSQSNQTKIQPESGEKGIFSETSNPKSESSPNTTKPIPYRPLPNQEKYS
jgi:hypothetical protein